MNISTYSRSQLRKLEKKRKNRSCLMVYLGSLSSNDVLKCRGKSRAQESRFTWMKDVFWCRFIHQQEKKREIWETLSFLLRIVLPSYFAEPNVVKRLTLLMIWQLKRSARNDKPEQTAAMFKAKIPKKTFKFIILIYSNRRLRFPRKVE